MDIQHIVKSLIDSGMTQSEIAHEVQCSQPTISGIATGQVGKTRPSYKVVTGLKRLAESRQILCRL
ncbi:helix-turn-helix domain-containing protein [Massilia sp. S19_KUP03_FR1]|uniref:helix-turn-helix domain-containing protein n=1 Tax=Massilia sp. S19_KUP03_FR1 TaxID=3025503 RepID=UPI002FCCC032